MQARRKIAVAGATGTVGRHVVDVLEAEGHDVVGMSRSLGVDVLSGDGLDEALEGVECIIDVANGPSPDQQAATKFFTAAARNLQEAGERAGVQRMVVVSIIGCDRFTAGYLAAKAAHERAMLSGPIPVRIVRAAQFHEFVGPLVEWGRHDGVSYVPNGRTPLVAARTVAQALAELATGPESASAPGSSGVPILEIAGPREESLVEMAKLLVTRRGDPVRLEGVSGFYGPADPDRELYESGALLPAVRTPPSPARRSRSGSTPRPDVPQQLTVKGQSPSRALNVTSRLSAAGCLPIEMVNEKETDHMATYGGRFVEEVVLWA
jgi:uncharacterized protein YbjT (DUF2867 family)